MKTWQPSLNIRSQADDVYQRRHNDDVKAMGNSTHQTGSRFSPLADTDNDNTMNWQNNTKRDVDDAKEMKNNHLTDNTDKNTLTTNDTRLSIQQHACNMKQ